MKTPKKYDLGWGESVAVRREFLATVNRPLGVNFSNEDLTNLSYPDHFGEPALVELTRSIIQRQTGNDYKYILITNGATGGVTIALRGLKSFVGPSSSEQICITRKPPYFRLYPSMISAAGLKHAESDLDSGNLGEARIHGIILIDSLSNPTCQFSSWQKKIDGYDPVIWDAVYYGNVYAPGKHPQPEHDVMIGSYSKLTGLNGLRIGWIASNDKRIYENMKVLVEAEYCGISAASTRIVMETAGKFDDRDWRFFETMASASLDVNREWWSKLEKFFGGQAVNPYGMFYYAPMDKSCKKLFEKSGIIWSPGSHLGTDDNFGRFNIGQGREVVLEAVKTILKNDKLK